MTATNGKPPVLEVSDLKTYFHTSAGVARAVDGISFSIREGETFAIVGESGCGKSVTSLSIMQLLPKPAGFIAGGKILLLGRDVTAMSEREKRDMRGNQVSMIFQEPQTCLNPVFTCGQQIVEAIVQHQKVAKAGASKLAIEMLEKVGIPAPAQRFGEYPHQLSGGMKQRVMIAMALACKPALLIADEPTTALDVTIQAQILALIRELQHELGTAVLLITHDLGVVKEMADRVGVMYAGKMAEQAPREALFKNPSHPYTKLLLRSLPSRTQRGQELASIPGLVPKATQFPPGCRFAERCPWVLPSCRTVLPTASQAPRSAAGATGGEDVEAPNHQVWCHLFDEHFESERGKSKVELERAPDPRAARRDARPAPLLQVRDLRVHFPIKKGILQRTVGWVRAVDGVDIAIPAGRTLALVGESGCGKTTVGKSLLQLIRPTDGAVYFEGEDLVALSRGELRPFRRKLGIIFQDPYSALNPRMMVGEIIEEGMRVHGLGQGRADREGKIRGLLAKVGLDPDMIHRYPHEFSGGQRQRIGIARVLAVEPSFIVCDEATSALDVSVQAQILNLLARLQAEFELTYLFITHDLSVVSYLADEVAVMYLGRVVERGTTEEVFASPKHPYTRALLSAVPKVDADGKPKIRLQGDVPSPIDPPNGCHFHPRCAERIPHCDQLYPGSTRFGPTHTCRCYLHSDATGNEQKPASS